MVIDKLTVDERLLMLDLISKRNALKQNIEMLIRMDMDLEVQIHRHTRDIFEAHGLDTQAGYQFQPNGEITL